ncbi:MAG: DUF6638 family protein [Bdellovibrionota bacterium]
MEHTGMERLMAAKLFGDGLLPVDSPALVSRYNECLTELGIAPTSLDSFDIDGMGWSPQIAQEKGDVHYLSAGVPNQLGIIVSPNQRSKPIYFPFHSYDRQLMDMYFSRFKTEVADITASRAIGLDIDQELTRYDSPKDLCLVNYVIVRSFTGKLGEVAGKQKKLIERLFLEQNIWNNQDFRKEVAESARDYGDLRHRKVEIPELRFDNIESFYTRAFGGVFVLHVPETDRKILLLEDPALAEQFEGRKDMYGVKRPNTINALCREGLLELNPAWYQSYPQVLAYLKECLTAEMLCANDPDLRYAELNAAQKRQRLLALGDRVWEVYYDLERFIKQLQSSSAVSKDSISERLKLLLLRPKRELSLPNQQVLRQFLHRLTQIDIIQLYADDKNFFFEQYRSWPASKQAWAVEKITQDYILESAQA